MKIFVTGTRGIPNIPGGVETHCEQLYPRMVARGHEVHIATRDSYVEHKEDSWQGVHLHHIHSPRLKSLEAILHTFLALLKARTINPDVVHIHAVGPALLVPFARLLGLKVVFTNHGPDYDRQKWGKVAKAMLRLGEKLGGGFANEVIVVSKVIGDIIKKRCGRDTNLIFNGVVIPEPAPANDYVKSLGAEPGKYILAVARFVPEKGLTDLIEAFNSLDTDHTLVIAGDADHETSYSRRVKELALTNPRIVLTGYISGEKLRQVYSHAGLFVLPSYHEGLPIALLEALSYGLPVLVSDIPANQEVAIGRDHFFRCGDIEHLVSKIRHLLAQPISENEKASNFKLLSQKHKWDRIAEDTLDVYAYAIGESIKAQAPIQQQEIG